MHAGADRVEQLALAHLRQRQAAVGATVASAMAIVHLCRGAVCPLADSSNTVARTNKTSSSLIVQNSPRVAWWQAHGIRSCVVDVDLKWIWLTLAVMFALGMLIQLLSVGA